MGRGLNKVMIIGMWVVTLKCVIRPVVVQSQISVWQPVAHGHRQKGERHEETEWFNVVAWGNLAEICKSHLHKGQKSILRGVYKLVVGKTKAVRNISAQS
jgi:single-strand DNA-binding protein